MRPIEEKNLITDRGSTDNRLLQIINWQLLNDALADRVIVDHLG